MGSDDFEEALTRYEAAQRAVVRGDAEPNLRLWSRREDVTLANPVSASVRGYADVAATAERAVSQLRDGEVGTFERISAYATEELGYLHGIERARARIGEGDEMRTIALRVTTIFRREDGEWRVIHRHADPITESRPIESIVAGS
jgi:ketosteroid isomerase-like protein